MSALALLICCGGCMFVSCDDMSAPDPLGCDNAPSEAAVTEVLLATGPEEPPVPLEHGDPTYLIVGVQGASMVTLRAIWRGDDAPACGKARFTITDPETGTELESESFDLASTPFDGGRVSGEVYFISEGWPSSFEVELEMYGVTVTRRLLLGGWGRDDAGVDAGKVDVDAGAALDGGADAGGAVDGGTSDDAGAALDASATLDAASTPDAASDAGESDAAASDAGAADTGP